MLAECERPGASVAAVALAHRLNANVVHKWRRAANAGTAAVASFLPVALPAPAPAVQQDIRVEVRRGARTMTIVWQARLRPIAPPGCESCCGDPHRRDTCRSVRKENHLKYLCPPRIYLQVHTFENVPFSLTAHLFNGQHLKQLAQQLRRLQVAADSQEGGRAHFLTILVVFLTFSSALRLTARQSIVFLTT